MNLSETNHRTRREHYLYTHRCRANALRVPPRASSNVVPLYVYVYSTCIPFDAVWLAVVLLCYSSRRAVDVRVVCKFVARV